MSAILHHNTKDTLSFVRILRHYCSPFCISQYERHTVVCSHIASFMSAILHHCNDSYRNKIPNLTSQVCLLQRVATLVSNVIIVPHSAYHNTKPTKMKSQRHTVFRLNLAASFQPHCIIICAVPHSSKAEPWYTHCCYISHHSCSTPFILHHSCCMLHHSCCIIQENPLLLHLTPFM